MCLPAEALHREEAYTHGMLQQPVSALSGTMPGWLRSWSWSWLQDIACDVRIS